MSKRSYWTRRRDIVKKVALAMGNCKYSDDSDNESVISLETEFEHCSSDSGMAETATKNSDNNSDEYFDWDNKIFDDSSVYNSSECSESDNQSEIEVGCLKENLRQWALEYGITIASFTALLKLLSLYHSNLPCDGRTILQTPVTTIVRELPSGGHYFHSGIKEGLEELIISGGIPNTPMEIDLQFNGWYTSL